MKIAHLIYKLDVGGLERFMVDMINRFPTTYEHEVICLTEATEFQQQLKQGVSVVCLNKKPGQDPGVHIKLAQYLRKSKPDVLHTYNLATIEFHFISRLVGVKGHLHAEHGREITDPKGLNWKHNLLRRMLSPFVHTYVAVSEELQDWLVKTVRISANKVEMIPNGIDLTRYPLNETIGQNNPFTFLHVARLQAVKNQELLIKAFDQLCRQCASNKIPLPKLCVVGDGAEKKNLLALYEELEYRECISFEGMQQNVIPYYAAADAFVLSSLAEGTPMTVLEAMASGLPVIATAVGGLPQVLSEGVGYLVEPGSELKLKEAMMSALIESNQSPDKWRQRGKQSRERMELCYNQQSSDGQYQKLYERSLAV